MSVRGCRRLLAVAAVMVGVLASASGAQAQGQELIVQSTTSLRDSGLLERIIQPGFRQAYPQYDLRFVAVGTGQAIANARAGQGDVLITHAPSLERQFVADGFSHEPSGRTIAWNDYVIVGPASDPAGVGRVARNDAVAGFEAIAAAGATGAARFVSRGDNSGTNTKEREIWAGSGSPRNARNEPGSGANANPGWYTKAGLGMGDTLRLTLQCPGGGGCYTITDRGTLQQLVSNGALNGLSIVMDEQRADARGGENLMVNAYRAYAVSPARVPQVKLQGALAFLDYVTSAAFQAQLETFPTREQRGFFGAAFPAVALARALPRRLSAKRMLSLSGRVTPVVPGEPALAGLRLRLARFVSAFTAVALDRGRAGVDGRFSLSTRLTRSGEVFLLAPRYRDLSPLRRSLGRVTVLADVSLRATPRDGRRVRLEGGAWPAAGRRGAVLSVRARQAGRGRFRVVRRVRLTRPGSRYRLSVRLPAGRWEVQTRYADEGTVEAGVSRVRTVTVR